MTEKKVITAQEARAFIKQPKLVTLPSGLTVKVQRLTPMDYLKAGLTEIPNEFFVFVVELQQGKLDLTKGDENKQRKNFELFEKFVTITIEQGCIEPPMLFKYNKEKEESHLLYSELSNQDQAVLVNEIIGKA